MTQSQAERIREYVERVVDNAPWVGNSNPFGKWTKHRATIAALNRSDARDAVAEADARQLLKAARLADQVLKVRGDLTERQRAIIAGMLVE